MLVFKCGYIVAILRLCAVVAKIDLFGGAGEAIVMRAPILLELLVKTPAGYRVCSAGEKGPHQLVCAAAMRSPPLSLLPAACRPTYAYIVARDNR